MMMKWESRDPLPELTALWSNSLCCSFVFSASDLFLPLFHFKISAKSVPRWSIDFVVHDLCTGWPCSCPCVPLLAGDHYRCRPSTMAARIIICRRTVQDSPLYGCINSVVGLWFISLQYKKFVLPSPSKDCWLILDNLSHCVSWVVLFYFWNREKIEIFHPFIDVFILAEIVLFAFETVIMPV